MRADEGLFTPEVNESGRKDVVDFVKNIQAKVNAQEGNYPSGICIYRIM